MKNMSRRSCLRNSLAGAAGLAAAGILGPVGAIAEGKTTYKPGTYTASAKGISSDVTVTILFRIGDILEMNLQAFGDVASRKDNPSICIIFTVAHAPAIIHTNILIRQLRSAHLQRSEKSSRRSRKEVQKVKTCAVMISEKQFTNRGS